MPSLSSRPRSQVRVLGESICEVEAMVYSQPLTPVKR